MNCVRSLILAMALSFSGVSWGAQGRELSLDAFQPQMCLLDYSLRTETIYAEVCSGILIAPDVILTAGHCVSRVQPRRIRCGVRPGVSVESYSEVASVRRIELHPSFQELALIGNIGAPVFDLAKIHLNERMAGQPVSLLSSLPTAAEPADCRVFGFSKVLGQRSSEMLTVEMGWELSSASLKPQGQFPILLADGHHGRSFLVEPGDSGGALFCKSKGEWKLTGITSARDFSYRSFFTSLIELGDWVKADQRAFSEAEQSQARTAKALAENQMAEFQRQNLISRLVKLKNFWPQAKSYLDQLQDLKSELNQRVGSGGLSTLQVLLNFETQIQNSLAKTPGLIFRLKGFSIIGRGEYGEPLSIVDLRYNYFRPFPVQTSVDVLQGEMILFGPSDQFVCRDSIFCAASNRLGYVEVSVQDLELEVLNRFPE